MENNSVFKENDSNSATETEEDTKINGLTLEDCFRNIIDGNGIEFELDNLNNILKKDLQVNFHYLKPKLKYVMPYMLVHFIKSWPGWQKSGNYTNKQITYKNWFAKFKEYLVFKINYLIKNDYEKVLSMVKANLPIEDHFKVDKSTQISLPSEKIVAPYAIQIQGTPKMLNSLIFCGGPQDSIIIREYRTNSHIQTLTTKQLFNWPYVEIEFLSKELNFKRKNMHEFKRYLMSSNEKLTFKKVENLIEEIEIISEQLNRTVYTLNVLREYCDTYINILTRHQKAMGTDDEYLADIKTLFDEFIKDIAELNMNSMATNTSVLFNIGRFVYARNKSVRRSDHAVSFAEYITPKVNLFLFFFTGLKDEKSDTPFEELQNLLLSTDKDYIKTFLPILKFRCTYCNVCYDRKVDILDHFKQKHCMEQPVLCFRCKLALDVPIICKNRWSHHCCSKINPEETVTR